MPHQVSRYFTDLKIEMEAPFSNLLVIELSSVLAGPMVGSFFAELGAEVIKIENALSGGDVTRSWRTSEERTDTAISAYYASANTGKTVQKLNLKLEADRQTVYDLVQKADVVISNYQKQVARKLGMDASTLRKRNPKLIYGEVYGYPNEDRPAFDAVLQAETGFVSMCGTANGELVKMPVALIDIIAAHHLKEGILTALIQRGQTGKGALVKVSLFDAAIASLANQASNYLMANVVPGPKGLCHPNIAPYGDSFVCEDGKMLLLAVGSDAQFAKMCTVLNLDALAEEERFKLNRQRVLNRSILQSELEAAFLKKPLAEWLTLFEAENIPVGAIKNLEEVFALPNAQRLIIDEQIEGEKTRKVKTVVFEISD